MEHRRNSQSRLSYSNLFNLESLMSYQLPQRDKDIDAYGSSSQDESRGSQGHGGVLEHENGYVGDRFAELSVRRRKRSTVKPESGLMSSLRREPDSNDEDGNDYDARMTEEQYRAMLGTHVQKYHRKRYRDSSMGSTYTRSPRNVSKQSHGSKFQKSKNDSFHPVKEEMTSHYIESSPEMPHAKSVPEHDDDSEFASSLDSTYLEISEGITYQIPPSYDKLAASLKLPSFSDIRIEEHYLKGTLDLQSLASMVASDRSRVWSYGGMGEPLPQYESLQAKLKALSAVGSVENFSLQVSNVGLDALGIPEGAAGRIRRLILSEAGTLQVFYVKVLEKGDTYEIIERSLPKRQVAKKDPSLIEKEEMEKTGKVWMNIVRRDLPRHHRIFTNIHRKRYGDAKRCSETCQREVKLKVSRSLKVMRGASIRTRKLARDMLVFWKRVDKEQAELRKKEEKEAAEALKREEELREAKRQQQRLNFLLSQTELYSHFMQNKSAAQASENLDEADGDVEPSEMASSLSDTKPEEDGDAEELELKKEALRAAQNAVSKQKKITSAFDSECLRLRGTVETEVTPDEALASDSLSGSTNIDLLHPSTMPITSSVRTPEMFKGTLKEYQLKGLQWLVNCYEQGLNGILADEMGLGKTIQAMAFLAHLAEEKNIWGPFLVVAPSSVLNNWVDEVGRFCPDLKTLPYWGGLQERTVLRKNINPKRLYRRDAGFHILITSYQLLVSDEKYLRRVKWQYMVLDEAQAIKSSSSIRWKTLLSFNCRNRLLLTGTPIQNNMAELWALLHFIMPTLFDSHEQFNEWFSKGIENHAEHGGTLNEHQLNRLHAVLKPFMLRRVKKDVISEMTGKTEVTVHCKLSTRQQAFYQAIKNKISLAELIDGSRGSLNEKKFLNLMNIVIQLRKVCNHPELFERNEGSMYVYFAKIPNPLLPPPFGELEYIHYPGGWNPIIYEVPKLVIQESFPDGELPWVTARRGSEGLFDKLFNVFSPENVYRSSVPLPNDTTFKSKTIESGAFGFTRLMDLSPMEFSFLVKGSLLERLLFSILKWDGMFVDEILDKFMEADYDDANIEQEKVRVVSRMLLVPAKYESSLLRRRLATGPGHAPFEALALSHKDRFNANTKLLHSTYAYIPRARAPPIYAHCSDRMFAYRMVEELHDPWIKRLLLGFARTSDFNGPRRPIDAHHLIREIDSELHISEPILQQTHEIFGSSPPIRNFDPAKMLTESGKLQMLDTLLKRLRAENHRVLLFAQMTKMLDILEDYMNYRKYRYLRLDGSSTIVDRRDMVRDFQRRNDIFVFLLSTRAGGLGINLTAADTVIFYESDWNPTLDLQAMDRAHRLGQTKEVTVYRMICKETVEEKILQRASQKNTVQQLVMTGGHVQGDLLKTEDVVSLLLDDAQLEQKLREIPLQQVKDRPKKKRVAKGVRLDLDGEATFEEFPTAQVEGSATVNKKRKSTSKKQASNLQNSYPGTADKMETDEHRLNGSEEDLSNHHRPKRARDKNGSIESSPVVGKIVPDLAAGTSDYQMESRSMYNEADTQLDTGSQ